MSEEIRGYPARLGVSLGVPLDPAKIDTPTMPLTDTQIRTAKPDAKPYKLSDGGGLHLVVKPNGSKLWRLKYRSLGREKLLSFGAYPHVTLKAARRAREEAKELIAQGLDPSEQRQAAKAAEARERKHTFRALAEAYVSKQRKEGRAASTIAKTEWLLAMAFPDLGHLPAAAVTAPLILKAVRRVEARGTHETAHRLRTVIGTVLRFGIASGWLEADPTPGLKGALIKPAAKPRAAITDKKALGRLLVAMDGFEGQPTTRIALQLMALLYPRPGELRRAEWSEFDRDAKIWTIPEERMKMRRPHRMPLPQAAIDRLDQLEPITGNGVLVFPSIRSAQRAMSDNTMNAALRRMGYSSDEMTAHGFRASFSTLANESGLWNPDAIERALAHMEENDIRRAYARGEHWDERVRMADWWAGLLDEMRSLG